MELTNDEVAKRAFIDLFPDTSKEKALKAYEFWSQQDQETQRDMIRKLRGEGDPKYIDEPVDALTFLEDKFYLGLGKDAANELYYDGCVVPEFIEMNSGKYVEVVCTGGIGSAKTTLALWGMARQLYLLSLLKDPHKTYGIAATDEILFVFQSITKQLSQAVDYDRFKNLIMRSPYFQRHFKPDPTIKSELRFPHRVIVRPVSGSSLAAIGQNVFGALIDELNYMAVVEESKKSFDATPFDQATEIYNAIARRRVSRFQEQGILPGILFLVSSKKYPGQFTDQKMEERDKQLKETGKSHIYVYDRRMWDIKPKAFSAKKMNIFIGDEFRKPRILADGEKVPPKDAHLITLVPEDLRQPFEKDIVNALREIAGISHMAKFPFFTNPEPIQDSFGDIASIFSAETVDFEDHQLKIIKSAIKRTDEMYPRAVHIDLGVTGDAAGLAIGHIKSFVQVDRGDGHVENMPFITIDGVLRIVPPRGGEIKFFKIRRILYILMQLGFPINWVTADTFQSTDTLQILRQKGITVGAHSVDATMLPYDTLKTAMYDGRIEIPTHDHCMHELRNLQINLKDQKVDHLPNGSKDCADALAGVAYILTTRRDLWALHGIPISERMVSAMVKSEKKMKEGEKRPELPERPEEERKSDKQMKQLTQFYGGDGTEEWE